MLVRRRENPEVFAFQSAAAAFNTTAAQETADCCWKR
jgi:hypothetical protein